MSLCFDQGKLLQHGHPFKARLFYDHIAYLLLDLGIKLQGLRAKQRLLQDVCVTAVRAERSRFLCYRLALARRAARNDERMP